MHISLIEYLSRLHQLHRSRLYYEFAILFQVHPVHKYSRLQQMVLKFALVYINIS